MERALDRVMHITGSHSRATEATHLNRVSWEYDVDRADAAWTATAGLKVGPQAAQAIAVRRYLEPNRNAPELPWKEPDFGFTVPAVADVAMAKPQSRLR